MENGVSTYSPSDVILTFGGYTVTGWQSIEIERSTPGFKVIRGIRGKNTRVRNRDTSAAIRVSILQTSYANDILSDVHEKDLETGYGRIEIGLKDTSGSSIFKSKEAYIVKYPSTKYSNDFEYRDWEIFCLTTSVFKTGGNNLGQGGLFESVIERALDLF